MELSNADINTARLVWSGMTDGQKREYMVMAYRILLNIHPEYKDLFPNDLEPVRDNMRNTIGQLIQNLDKPGDMQPVFQRLGQSHQKLGIKAEMFPHMVDSKVQALAEIYGDGISAEHLTHWRSTMQYLAENILGHYPS